MGKIRRLRQKYHLARAKSMNDISSVGKDENSDKDPFRSQEASPRFSIAGNLFEGIDIPLNCNQSLREDDVRSIVTTKSSFKDCNLSKVAKRTLRHDTFMKKLDLLQHLKREANDRKKRQRTAITGDLRPLVDALPSVELLGAAARRETEAASLKRSPPKQKSLPKAKQRQKNTLKDISAFRRVLSDPAFKADPSGTISNFIQEKIQAELMDEA